MEDKGVGFLCQEGRPDPAREALYVESITKDEEIGQDRTKHYMAGHDRTLHDGARRGACFASFLLVQGDAVRWDPCRRV